MTPLSTSTAAMDTAFWLERWASNQIGFHQHEVHPRLREHWPGLGVRPNARVFVPLAGKSLDLAWLRGRGHAVIGVELSAIAVEAFFDEHAITPVRDTHGPFLRYRAQGYTLLCGDYFALTPALLGACEAVYDRAALVALPADLRARYAAQIDRLVPAGARMLLITVGYDSARISPPPFLVDDTEVARLYADGWSCVCLGQAPARIKDEIGTETTFALTRM